MKTFADPFMATAIFGSAEFDQPENLDDVVGDEVDDELQEPFTLFFDRAALQNLGHAKSDSPAITSSLAKAAITRKFGIARTEERLIDGTRWACAFDADGNLVDSQELEPGSLGKRSSEPGWDDQLVASTSSLNSNDLHKRAKDPKVARIEKTVYPSGSCVVAELDENNVCIRTYRVET